MDIVSAAVRVKSLRTGPHMVLILLADMADPERHMVRISQRDISIRAKMSERSILSHLQALDAAGFITRSPNPDDLYGAHEIFLHGDRF